MKDLQLRPITLFGSRGHRGRYNLELPPPAAHISYKQEMVGNQYGWVRIISPEKRWNMSWSSCYVLTECSGCGAVQWQNLSNLQRGISKGCQGCSKRRQIPVWLEKRLGSAKQRCENPNAVGYNNYGGRGIRFDFPSVIKAGLFLIDEFGMPSREMEIDRIDNEKNYTYGNVRFVTHSENTANRRCTVLTRFSQKYWPYVQNVVITKLSRGLTRDEIILSAESTVSLKRKNWKIVSARLDFMTYEMPEDIIVLPYREGSSTTAATAGL